LKIKGGKKIPRNSSIEDDDDDFLVSRRFLSAKVRG
ncbi:unnamed protein product, partial [Arabidopsis halleri]